VKTITQEVDRILSTDLIRAFIVVNKSGWGHHQWVTLLEALKNLGFHNFDEAKLGTALQHQRGLLEELTNNDYFWTFLKEHKNGWNHNDWLHFMQTAKTKGFEDLDENIVGLVLNEKKGE